MVLAATGADCLQKNARLVTIKNMGDHAGHHHGHEEDNNSNSSSNLLAHMMQMHAMIFHFGSEETILFGFWHTTSAIGLFFSCVLVVCACFGMEVMRWYRLYRKREHFLATQRNGSGAGSAAELTPNSANQVGAVTRARITSFVDAGLHALQLTLSYMLMLIFMTFNVWLCAAIVLGEVGARLALSVLFPQLDLFTAINCEMTEQNAATSKAEVQQHFAVPSISCVPATFTAKIGTNKSALSRPVCVGEFSLDSGRTMLMGRSQVRYFHDAVLGQRLSADLTHGMDTFIAKQDSKGIDQILRWIVAMAPSHSSLKKAIHECEFVLWRGTLTRLCASPYDVRPGSDGLKVACAKYNGVYFIREIDTAAKLHNESARDQNQRKAGYAGHKFEQLITVDDHGANPDPSAPVDQNKEFVGMFKATLMSGQRNSASIRLLYGAEIDCISQSSGEYLEAKTQFRAIGFGRGFKSKALKWWIQSYLIGIKELIVGVHEDLVLRRVEVLPMCSLEKHLADHSQIPTCFEFAHTFLSTLRRCVDSLAEGTILMAEREPASHEFAFKAISAEHVDGQREHRVLSDQFTLHMWR